MLITSKSCVTLQRASSLLGQPQRAWHEQALLQGLGREGGRGLHLSYRGRSCGLLLQCLMGRKETDAGKDQNQAAHVHRRALRSLQESCVEMPALRGSHFSLDHETLLQPFQEFPPFCLGQNLPSASSVSAPRPCDKACCQGAQGWGKVGHQTTGEEAGS